MNQAYVEREKLLLFFFLPYSWKHVEAGAISILSTRKYKVIHLGTQVQILSTE